MGTIVTSELRTKGKKKEKEIYTIICKVYKKYFALCEIINGHS